MIRLLAVLLLSIPLGTGAVLGFENQIREEARYIAGQIAEKGKTAVAVVDFTDLDGAVTHLGRFMAEELSVALAGASRSFRVVDRSHIRSLLQEHKLSASGLIDPNTARELGRIAGVDTLITATLTPLGDSIRLSIKVLDSDTAQVLASSSCSIPKTQAVDSLLRRGVAGSIGGGSSSIASAGSSQGAGGSMVVNKGQVQFTLQGCQKQGDTIVCHLSVLNQGADRRMKINDDLTRILDAFGNEFYASSISFGSQGNTYGVTRSVVRNIPIRAGAIFEGPSPDLRRLALVEFQFDNFTIQFKDVPIS